MPRIRIWDILLGAALLAMLAHMILLVRQRSALEEAIDGSIADKPAAPPLPDERINRLSELRQERDSLATSLQDLQGRCAQLDSEKERLTHRVAALETHAWPGEHREAARLVQGDLDAANDRLDKAYRDIAEMERQLVDVSRAKNDIEQQLENLRGRHPLPPDPTLEPKIDGVVLGLSDKVNLVLISVGAKDKVQVGYKFTVYRGSEYISKLVVDKVEDGWAACRELTEFRKSEIQQGDNVSTRVFD